MRDRGRWSGVRIHDLRLSKHAALLHQGYHPQFTVNSMNHILSPPTTKLNQMSVLFAMKYVIAFLKDVILVSSRIVVDNLGGEEVL